MSLEFFWWWLMYNIRFQVWLQLNPKTQCYMHIMQCGTDLTYCNFTLGFIFNWDMSVTLCEAHFWYFSVVLALQVFVSDSWVTCLPSIACNTCSTDWIPHTVSTCCIWLLGHAWALVWCTGTGKMEECVGWLPKASGVCIFVCLGTCLEIPSVV